VTLWEYRKIDLTAARGDGQEIEWLNQAGAEGWELVRITDNNVAYLKREMASGSSKGAANHMTRGARPI
jgi:hypothetical protein